MPEHGYPRFPTIHDDTIVFASEDDLWITSAGGGQAVYDAFHKRRFAGAQLSCQQD